MRHAWIAHCLIERNAVTLFSSLAAQFAVDAVTRATRLVQLVQRELAAPALTKDDRSPVTVADFAAQALVCRALQTALPADVLVGEESAADLREPGRRSFVEQIAAFVARDAGAATAEQVCDWIDVGRGEPCDRFWTLDPVDGTKGFLRGEQYVVALAQIVDGRVVLGVLGCPNLGGPGGVIAAAERGAGAWTRPLAGGDWRRIYVSALADAAQARIMRSVEAGHTDEGKVDALATALGSAAPPIRMDSQAKFVVVAQGDGELIFRLLSPARPGYREKIWDQAAGSIVVEEAGGRVSDLDGKPLDFTRGRSLEANRGVLVSNGALHDAALAALRAVDA